MFDGLNTAWNNSNYFGVEEEDFLTLLCRPGPHLAKPLVLDSCRDNSFTALRPELSPAQVMAHGKLLILTTLGNILKYEQFKVFLTIKWK